MVAKKEGPGRPRNEKVDGEILNATMELIVDLGYQGLTISKVADRASVSKATIYRRWESKQHLVIAAFDTTPHLQCTITGDLVSELKELLGQFLGILENSPLGGVLPTLIGERARDPELSVALDPMIKARRKPIREAVQRAVERGELPKATNLELAVDMFVGPLIMRLMFGGTAMTPTTLSSMLTMTLLGLKSSK